jgi:hypothetical protein
MPLPIFYPRASAQLALAHPQLGGRVNKRSGRIAATLLVWLLVLLSGGTAEAQRPLLQLSLAPSSGPGIDFTSIYFQQNATIGFDALFDAPKLLNSTGLNLASLDTSGQQIAIKGLPPTLLSAPYTVGLYVAVPQYGSYVLQASQLTNFTATGIELFDNLLATSTPLVAGTGYSFDLTAANTAGTGIADSRFELRFQPLASPLPVTLTSFTAVAQAAGVRVGWRTASERQSHYFAVERSLDGQAFAEIGRVAAAGTSGQPQHYALLDAQPLAAVAYYRLRQVDLDGSLRYSAVRVVAPSSARSGPHLFPVPARTWATLLGAVPGELVRVLDTRGRFIMATRADEAGTAALTLPAGLASGLYLVQAAGHTARLLVE